MKIVPNKSSSGQDNRRQFFIDNANSNKYYYMPIGDVQHNPNRNTLVPLGTFLGFIDYRPAPGGYGMMKIDDGNVGTEYYMRFSNYPYNATDREVGAVGMDINPLVYTDEPPAAGSVPLHYYDYVQMIYPKAFDENGRPIYNERFPIQFGDGENGWGVQTFRPPGYLTEQMRNSTFGAANFVAKSGGRKKTQNRKNRKSKKTQKYKKSKKTK